LFEFFCCRFNCTPLDDAVQRGNSVAALALEHAGGLRSSDERLVEYLAGARSARVKWWRDARKKTVAEIIARSAETELWRSAEERSLPLLLNLLSSIEDRHHDLEAVLSVLLRSLHCALKHAVFITALQQGQQGWESSNFCKSVPGTQNVQSSCPSNGANTSVEGHLSQTQYEAEEIQSIQSDSQDGDLKFLAIDGAITRALDGIAVFFSRDMEEAQEATALELLTRGRYLQPSCTQLAQSIQALRAQVLQSASQS
jgi:hypothetical protein